MSISSLIKQELAVLKEKYLFAVDESLQDPVFEGVVRDFNAFSDCITAVYQRIARLTSALDSVSLELCSLSEQISESYKRTVQEDHMIVSDCYKFREAANQIGRVDAPHSSLAKFRRDLDYNIMVPLRSHLNNCRQLRNIIDLRNRKLVELSAAERSSGGLDFPASLRAEFEEVDQHLFDWFMILEEYKGDILDSLLQTIKYLEYEYFASSAHAVAAVLPARMEFRPMVEMTPKQLETQLTVEKKAREQLEHDVRESESQQVSGVHTSTNSRSLSDYSKRLIDKAEAVPAAPQVQVDILSLSSLLAQGFEEGPARKALRECNNDTQAALEFLLSGGRKSASSPSSTNNTEAGVRMPTTLHRLQRIKELKKRLLEKSNAANKDKASTGKPSPTAQPTTTTTLIESQAGPATSSELIELGEDFTAPTYQKPPLPSIDDLLFS